MAMVQTAEYGMVMFESPELGVQSPQRDERGGWDLIQPMHVSLRVNGQTERFDVTMQLSFAGKR